MCHSLHCFWMTTWAYSFYAATAPACIEIGGNINLLTLPARGQPQPVLQQRLELTQEFGAGCSGPLALLKRDPAPSGSHHSTAWQTHQRLHTCPLTWCPGSPHQGSHVKGRIPRRGQQDRSRSDDGGPSWQRAHVRGSKGVVRHGGAGPSEGQQDIQDLGFQGRPGWGG